jgi:hypothetical protein
MRSSVTCLLVGVSFLLGFVPAEAGKDKVELQDLALLDASLLDALRSVHHEVAVAEIGVAGAEFWEADAKAEAKAAKRLLDAPEADVDAAKAELKAAEKNAAKERTRAAKARLSSAEHDLAVAEAFVKWKEQEIKVRKEQVSKADATLDYWLAEMQLARAELVDANSNSNKYSLDEFHKKVAERKQKLSEASVKVSKETEKARGYELRWHELKEKKN